MVTRPIIFREEGNNDHPWRSSVLGVWGKAWGVCGGGGGGGDVRVMWLVFRRQ